MSDLPKTAAYRSQPPAEQRNKELAAEVERLENAIVAGVPNYMKGQAIAAFHRADKAEIALEQAEAEVERLKRELRNSGAAIHGEQRAKERAERKARDAESAKDSWYQEWFKADQRAERAEAALAEQVARAEAAEASERTMAETAKRRLEAMHREQAAREAAEATLAETKIELAGAETTLRELYRCTKPECCHYDEAEGCTAHWAVMVTCEDSTLAALAERDELKVLMRRLVPFIGWEAHVPDLVAEAEAASDFVATPPATGGE